MGILTTSGSLARVIGPIGVSFVYQAFGTYFTFGGICTILTLALLAGVLSYPHMKVIELQTLFGYFRFCIDVNCIPFNKSLYLNWLTIFSLQPPEDPKPLKEEESLLYKTKTTKVTFVSSNTNGAEDRKKSDSIGWLICNFEYTWI